MPHETLACNVPDAFEPLMSFLHTLTELALIAGIVVGTLGFVIAGLFYVLPGEDNTRRAKSTAKNTFIGVIILLSARMIMEFLVTQLGGTICV